MYQISSLIAGILSISLLAFSTAEICNVTEVDLQNQIFNQAQFVSQRPIARPIKNVSQTIEIFIRLVMFSIDIDEISRIVRLTGFIEQNWTDEINAWKNNATLACIDHIVVADSEIWIPDLALTNSDTVFGLTQLNQGGPIEFFSDGTVVFGPATTMRFYCNFNLRYFPFDQQVCKMRLEAWAYLASEQEFQLQDPAYQQPTGLWSENQQWAVVNISAATSITAVQYGNSPASYYSTVLYTFYLKRKSAYFVYNIVVPSIIIATMELLICALPPEEVVRMHISFTCLLAYTVFQTSFIGFIPTSSDNIPLISIYIDLEMAYIGLVILGDGINYFLLGQAERGARFPRCLTFGKMRSITSSEVQDNQDMKYWHQLIRLVGRTFFSIYLICASATPLILFLILPNLES